MEIIMWIARDKNGLFLFAKKPMFFEGLNEFGCMMGEEYCELPSNWLPEITFENSPKKVKFELVKENIIEKACKWLEDNGYYSRETY